MKRFKFSSIYLTFLISISALHFSIENLIFKNSLDKFIVSVIYAIFISYFLVVLAKILLAHRSLDFAIIGLIIAIIFFFLLSKSVFLYKLLIIEFFSFGILVSFENKKYKDFYPYLILIFSACLIEVITNASSGTRFYYLDVWINSISALSGYISFALLSR